LNAGEVYDLDDDGYNRDNGRTVEVPNELEDAARRGAESCPDQAIRIMRQ
jgi:ferredoxin